MPNVTIVIPCFNSRLWIVDTLRSALQPTANPIEVIVVDDGSTDSSSNLVRQIAPQVQLVITKNHGVSHARNMGIERSNGDYLVFLDSDDVLIAGKIDRQVDLLENSGADVAYGNWRRLRASGDGLFKLAETIERSMTREPELELFGNFWCPTGAYLFRRSIVEKVGGFSSRLPVIQDARFTLDCALHGGRFVHDPAVTCLYRTHSSGSVSTSSQKAFWRDCLTNALEVRDWWASKDRLTADRLAATVAVFDLVARATATTDKELFGEACREIDRYIRITPPCARPASRLLIRILGYRFYRKLSAEGRKLWMRHPTEVGR